MANIELIICVGICFTGLSYGSIFGTNNDNKYKYVPARVTNVKKGIDNSYFEAVEDESSPTGWAVKVKKDMQRYDIDAKLLVYMFDNTLTEKDKHGKGHTFFGTFLCGLLISDSRFDQFPQHHNLPRDVIDLIFPGHQGSCNFTEGTNAILPSANVNIAEYDNPKVRFPNSSNFELYVNILSQKERPDVQSTYFFQVTLAVGNPTPYKCYDTYWNYYITWRICTIADFINSNIFAIGEGILNLF